MRLPFRFGKAVPTKRVVITFTDKAFQRLEFIKSETGAKDMAEVLRDAIELKEALINIMNEGKEIVIKDANGGLTPLFEFEDPVVVEGKP